MELSEIKNAAIYCGTYKKYNEGSLFGEWIKLADFADKEEFIAYCTELHKDEDDAELMFQDWEYIPDWLCGESWVSPIVWDLMAADDDDLNILGHYLSAVCVDTDNMDADELIEEAREKFVGKYESAEEIGEEMAEQLGLFSVMIPQYCSRYDRECYQRQIDEIKRYFNFEEYGKSFLYDWCEDDGYYFDTNR